MLENISLSAQKVGGLIALGVEINNKSKGSDDKWQKEWKLETKFMFGIPWIN